MRTCNAARLQTILLWRVPQHDILLDATRFDAGSEQASTECAEPAWAEMLRGTIVGEYLASAGAPKSLMQLDRGYDTLIDPNKKTKQTSEKNPRLY
jgi:hypothetical protein